MTTTTKYDLYFIARDGKSFKTVTTKASHRDADGLMHYEKPSDCFNRACRLIDLKAFKFHKAEAYSWHTLATSLNCLNGSYFLTKTSSDSLVPIWLSRDQAMETAGIRSIKSTNSSMLLSNDLFYRSLWRSLHRAMPSGVSKRYSLGQWLILEWCCGRKAVYLNEANI